MDNILLIDGNSILNRAYYGIRPLTTSDGLNTNAVYGFLTILRKHAETYAPCRICVAFDLKAKTYRHKLYSGYKAGRKGMPEELAEQVPVIKDVLDALGVCRIEVEGLEADDIIGILSKECSDAGENCIIVTGDRDSFQLVGDNITVSLAVTKQGGSSDEVYDRERVYEKYGLYPDKLIDLKALMGDASDNIPGVAGVGEKTASSLLQKYGSLEGVYENLSEVKGALHDKLEAGKDSAFMSRELGRIIRQAELPKVINDITEITPNKEKLTSLFARLEMSSMIKKFGLDEETAVAEATNELKCNIAAYSGEDFGNDGTAIALYSSDKLFIKYDGGIYSANVEENLLRKLSAMKIVTYNAKPLIKLMMKHGLSANIEFDALLAAYIINPSLSSYPLQLMAQEYAAVTASTEVDALFVLDAVKDKMLEIIDKNGQRKLLEDIELPLCEVLASMEYDGFAVDTAVLEKIGLELDSKIKTLVEAIYSFSGYKFNINSTKQLGHLLFEELGLPVIRKTKTGYSTDNEVLEKLLYKTEHPVIDNIIAYRKLTKLKSTYVDGLSKNIGEDGRIHTIFTQTVTQTGRISSIEPNLQNIPVRTENGKQLRKVFVTKEGFTLLDADYSQIELRVLAHISKDKTMTEAFIQNKDIHTITASEVFGLPEKLVTPELRRRAKAVNFGIVYGIGEYSLSQDIHVPIKQAKSYIDGYLNTYSGVNEYMKSVVEFARKNGYIETMYARRRYVPDINAKNKQIQAFAERVSRNTPIQGTAADLIKLAMVRVYRRLKELCPEARLILQVHDELILEVPENRADELKKMLKYEMEHAAELSVPLSVDVGEGKTWYDAKD